LTEIYLRRACPGQENIEGGNASAGGAAAPPTELPRLVGWAAVRMAGQLGGAWDPGHGQADRPPASVASGGGEALTGGRVHRRAVGCAHATDERPPAVAGGHGSMRPSHALGSSIEGGTHVNQHKTT
jgi:hypothetical protein